MNGWLMKKVKSANDYFHSDPDIIQSKKSSLKISRLLLYLKHYIIRIWGNKFLCVQVRRYCISRIIQGYY